MLPKSEHLPVKLSTTMRSWVLKPFAQTRGSDRHWVMGLSEQVVLLVKLPCPKVLTKPRFKTAEAVIEGVGATEALARAS